MASPNPASRGLAPELVFCTDAFQEFVAEHKKTEFNDNMAELAKFGSFCKKALESKGSLPDQCSFFESVYDPNAKLIIYCWNMLKEFTREYNEPKFTDHLAASRAFVWFATWNNALDTFLKEFDDNRGHYEALSGRVEEFCGRLLKLESIMHQTSSRTKSRESVEHKAKREVKKFRKPDRSDSSTDDEPNDALFNEPKDPLYQKPTVLDVKSRLSRRLVDLAGIRILVYFPDDVSKVIEAIKKSDAFDIEYAVLSFTRNRKDARGEDMDKQKQGTADINYLDGPWYSPPISPEEAARRWRHSGYRAVHLCVKSKGPLETEIIYDDSPRQSWRRKVTVEAKQLSPEAELFLEDKLAEIQITTVVMHAWSQVEHDVIYKFSDDSNVTETMTRMLDAVNGLSITSEILLEELRRTTEATQRTTVEEEKIPFSGWLKFQDWIKKAYLKKIDRSIWEEDPRFLRLAYLALQNWGYTSPSDVRLYIARQEIFNLVPRESEKLDISILILKRLSGEVERKPTHRSGLNNVLQCSSLTRANPNSLARCSEVDLSDKITRLYYLFLVANSFSIMVAIEEEAAIERFKNRFPNDIDKLRVINSIFLGGNSKTKELGEREQEERQTLLGNFAVRYLEEDWCWVHDAAVAIARHHMILAPIVDDKGLKTVIQPENLLRDAFEKSFGNFQAIMFPDLTWMLELTGQLHLLPLYDSPLEEAGCSLFSGYCHWSGQVPRVVMVLKKGGPMKNYILMKAKDDENCLWKFDELMICFPQYIHWYLHFIAEDRTFVLDQPRIIPLTNSTPAIHELHMLFRNN